MTGGMAARLCLALIAGLAGSVSLWRGWNRTGPIPPASPVVPLFRNLLFGLSGFWLAAWLVIAALRFHYPFELEWNSGAMRDHCARLLAGQPLFAPPTADWIPAFYTPLYVQICALIMRLAGGHVSYEAMRAVSIAATLGSGLLLFAWTRCLVGETEQRPNPETPEAAESTGKTVKQETIRRSAILWGCIAAGLFFTAYRMTGAWYDIERLDSLFLFWALLGGFLLEGALSGRRSASARAGGAGLVFALAVLTKQQGVLFLLAGGLAFTWRGEWRRLSLYTVVAVLVLGGGLLLDSRGTAGWFWRYLFVIPLAQGVQGSLIVHFLAQDMPLYAPCLGILACFLLRRKGRQSASGLPGSPCNPGLSLCVITIAALLISLSSRAHWGGYENVLIPAFAFTGLAACVVAGRLALAKPRLERLLLLLVLAQFIVLAYRPDKQTPTREVYAAGVAYRDAVQRLERQGSVLSFDHGGFTAAPHLHSMSLHNFVLAHQPVPEAVRAGFLTGSYDTILVDTPPEAGSDFAALIADYQESGSLNLSQSWVVTGFDTPNPSRRVWIFRPKKRSTNP